VDVTCAFQRADADTSGCLEAEEAGVYVDGVARLTWAVRDRSVLACSSALAMECLGRFDAEQLARCVFGEAEVAALYV